MAVLSVLSALSCQRAEIYREPADPQLSVSLYIPQAVITRAQTGEYVKPLKDELKITSLQIWVFKSDNGELISYKGFTDSESTPLGQTGIPNSSYTRLGLPLSVEWFSVLSAKKHPKVDVYAVANVASAVKLDPGVTTLPEGISRDELDALVVNNIGGGDWPLTMAVPEAGLPMSGVLKGTDVTGGYPILSISTLKLTRAVSKIRFVFAQQGIPAQEDTPAVIANNACEIVSISFDGTTGDKECQVSTTERLFTEKSIDLGDEPGYADLSVTITGKGKKALIPNDKLSIVEDPESLFFLGVGNETVERYEARLDASVSKDSQVGPIYLRETDKKISGKIHYRTTATEGEEEGNIQTAEFSMETGDLFSRNHTWVVYACFVEETRKLLLTTSVMPWDWERYSFDFKEGTVNVVRRFTVFETSPDTFFKDETDDGFYDIYFWHTVEGGEEKKNTVKGNIIISTPVGATLYVEPIPPKGSLITDAFIVTPLTATIYYNNQNEGSGEHIEDCQIAIEVKANTDKYSDQQLKGQYIDLHFCVETREGIFVDLGSESIDHYRFILDPLWYTYLPTDND